MAKLDLRSKQSDIENMAVKKPLKNDYIMVRMNTKLKRQLEQAAQESDFDSLSAWARTMLKKIVDGKLK